MFKFVVWVVVLTTSYILYIDGAKPYFDARKETETILQTTNIPFNKRNTNEYREQAMALLKSQCINNVYEISLYEFRCASGSIFSFIDELF